MTNAWLNWRNQWKNGRKNGQQNEYGSLVSLERKTSKNVMTITVARKNTGFNGTRTHNLCGTNAMLWPLNYSMEPGQVWVRIVPCHMNVHDMTCNCFNRLLYNCSGHNLLPFRCSVVHKCDLSYRFHHVKKFYIHSLGRTNSRLVEICPRLHCFSYGWVL